MSRWTALSTEERRGLTDHMLQVSALWPSTRQLPNSCKRIGLTASIAAQATLKLITA